VLLSVKPMLFWQNARAVERPIAHISALELRLITCTQVWYDEVADRDALKHLTERLPSRISQIGNSGEPVKLHFQNVVSNELKRSVLLIKT
jgi:hypothetical protein